MVRWIAALVVLVGCFAIALPVHPKSPAAIVGGSVDCYDNLIITTELDCPQHCEKQEGYNLWSAQSGTQFALVRYRYCGSGCPIWVEPITCPSP